MAILYGPGDLKNRVLPDGFDATELEKLRTESNISIEEITNLFVGAQVALNAELLNDPIMGQLFDVTLEPTVEYPTATTNEMKAHTEYGPVDEQRGAIQGHMLPRKAYDYALGWTWDYLRRCRRSQIEADIAGMINAGRDRFQKDILTRFTKMEDDSGAVIGLGSGGYSPAFCHAAASTEVDFAPPPWEGLTFDTDHEHYEGTAGTTAADWQAAIEEMTLDLFEHGHDEPYVLMVSNSDKGTVIGLDDYRPRAAAQIRYGLTQDLALVPELYIGLVDTPSGVAYVYVQNRLPQYYMLAFKSYGVRSPSAPLLVRYSDDMGLVLSPLTGHSYRDFPIEGLLSFAEYGVGVGRDRTNGTCHRMGNASYASPTIT